MWSACMLQRKGLHSFYLWNYFSLGSSHGVSPCIASYSFHLYISLLSKGSLADLVSGSRNHPRSRVRLLEGADLQLSGVKKKPCLSPHESTVVGPAWLRPATVPCVSVEQGLGGFLISFFAISVLHFLSVKRGFLISFLTVSVLSFLSIELLLFSSPASRWFFFLVCKVASLPIASISVLGPFLLHDYVC